MGPQRTTTPQSGSVYSPPVYAVNANPSRPRDHLAVPHSNTLPRHYVSSFTGFREQRDPQRHPQRQLPARQITQATPEQSDIRYPPSLPLSSPSPSLPAKQSPPSSMGTFFEHAPSQVSRAENIEQAKYVIETLKTEIEQFFSFNEYARTMLVSDVISFSDKVDITRGRATNLQRTCAFITCLKQHLNEGRTLKYANWKKMLIEEHHVLAALIEKTEQSYRATRSPIIPSPAKPSSTTGRQSPENNTLSANLAQKPTPQEITDLLVMNLFTRWRAIAPLLNFDPVFFEGEEAQSISCENMLLNAYVANAPQLRSWQAFFTQVLEKMGDPDKCHRIKEDIIAYLQTRPESADTAANNFSRLSLSPAEQHQHVNQRPPSPPAASATPSSPSPEPTRSTFDCPLCCEKYSKERPAQVILKCGHMSCYQCMNSLFIKHVQGQPEKEKPCPFCQVLFDKTQLQHVILPGYEL